MKIILFSRPRVEHVASEVAEIFAAIEHFGFDYSVNDEFAPIVEHLTGRRVAAANIYYDCVGHQSEAAVMVCYGGDGTLLSGVHRLGGEAIPVVGINSGHLGFLTSVPQYGIKALFEDIATGNLRIEPRSMLEVSGSFTQKPCKTLAVNEVSVQHADASVVSVETFVDGQMVATFHGDGVIISTPTGSTAYSLSAGGPVVAPQCACLIISPLASHNLTMRPVVVPDSSTIEMRVHSRSGVARMSVDNSMFQIADSDSISIKLAESKIFLVVPRNISFYDTLRNKMMWGIDLRSKP